MDPILRNIEHQKVDKHIAESMNGARINGAGQYELDLIDRVFRPFSHWLLDRKLANDDPNDVFDSIAILFTNITAELMINGAANVNDAGELAQNLINVYAEGVNGWLNAMSRDKSKDS